jgi:hypothetical protein
MQHTCCILSTTLTTTRPLPRPHRPTPTTAHTATAYASTTNVYATVAMRRAPRSTFAVVGSTAMWPPSVRNLLRGDCAASAVDPHFCIHLPSESCVCVRLQAGATAGKPVDGQRANEPSGFGSLMGGQVAAPESHTC